MKRICLHLAIATILVGLTRAAGFLELADEIRIPLPEGWELTGDSAAYPFQIVNASRTAEVLIFRSEVAADDAVNNSANLRAAVDQIVEDVILTLPDARLLTSNGYQQDNRAWFVLDFTSRDSLSDEGIRHRLMASLYRHPDGYQIMFTVWGKSSLDEIESEATDIKLIQDLFAYRGPSEKAVFTPERSGTTLLTYVGALMAIVILVFVFVKRGRRAGGHGFSEESHFWRCECGRMNHNNYATCRRCGKERSADIPT